MTDHADRAETLAERAGSRISYSERAGGEGTPAEVAAQEATLAVADATLSVGQRLADLGDLLETVTNRLNNIELRVEEVGNSTDRLVAVLKGADSAPPAADLQQTGDDDAAGPIRG